VVILVAIWGLDEQGFFRTSDGAGSIGALERIRGLWNQSKNSVLDSGDAGNVADRVLMDLKDVHARLLAETQLDTELPRGDKEKGKHLLFLFQRDLLPGVSGKILESKGQRDNIAVKAVSWQAKAAGWTFICLLDVGMLFYILLFAVSQTVHRQGAWALSFVMWLVVEILFVSSATVIFTHVFVPSLIMNDVNKIKLKLADSIRAFNNSVRRNGSAEGRADGSAPELFNAANFLFLSTRLAQQWSNLREAQIIAQFRTPWPKQSYQRETDVSQNYSKKYTALYRSASVIAIFFLTNLLNIPPAFQDMVIHMTTTASIGYTVLLHIDLYHVNPGLVIVPTLVIVIALYLLIRFNQARAKQRLEQLFPADSSSDAVPGVLTESASPVKQQPTKPEPVISIRRDASSDEGSEDEHGDRLTDLSLHLPTAGAPLAQPAGHTTRKQSVQYGMQLLSALKQESIDVPEEPSLSEMSAESDSLAPVSTSPPARVASKRLRVEDVSSMESKIGDPDEEWLDVSSESSGSTSVRPAVATVQGEVRLPSPPTPSPQQAPPAPSDVVTASPASRRRVESVNTDTGHSCSESEASDSDSDVDEADAAVSIAIPRYAGHRRSPSPAVGEKAPGRVSSSASLHLPADSGDDGEHSSGDSAGEDDDDSSVILSEESDA
jgi:hypothetical protein